MSDRETTLSGLGIALMSDGPVPNCGVASSFSDIPLLSGYSEFTPIRIVSSDVKAEAEHANLERDQQRD